MSVLAPADSAPQKAHLGSGTQPTPPAKGLRVINVGLFPPPYGGVSIHLQRLTERLQALGVACLLIDLSRRPKSHPGVVSWTWPVALLRLMLMRRSIVHFHNFAPRNAVVFWLISLRHITILSFHNERFVDELDQAGPLARALAPTLLARLQRVVVDSRESRLLAEQLVPATRITLIPEFLEPVSVPELTNPAVRRLRADHRFLLASNAFRIAFHDGQDLYGLDLLVEVLRRLRYGRKLDAALAFLLPAIGATEYFAKIRGQVERYGLTQHVVFVTEPLEEAGSLWRVSDVYVRATNTDGNSLSIMEALSLGVPVVASDCVDRPEGVVVFRTRDVDDLEAKLVDVLLRAEEYRRRVAALPPLDNGARFVELYQGLGMRPES